MFYTDTLQDHKDGIDRDEFVTLAKWVSGYDLDEHALEVMIMMIMTMMMIMKTCFRSSTLFSTTTRTTV